MQCNACGTPLPQGASACPRCDALTTSSSNYDAVPYIEYHTYMEQATPSTQSASPATIAARPFVPGARESIAVYPEQKARQSQGIQGWKTALIILLSLLLILGGIGSIVYAFNFQPVDLHAQATKVAQNFLTAQVRGTAQVNAIATATANSMTPEQVYQQATNGTPVIDDPLKDDSGSVWLNSRVLNAKSYICIFRDGAYHIQTDQGAFCIGNGTSFSDLAFQAQITIIKGQYGGLVFRLSVNKSIGYSYYYILIGTDGSYYIQAVNQQQTKTLASGTSRAIITGLNQPNRVTIIARSSHLNLYINDQYIDQAIDTNYSTGQLAFLTPDEATFTDVAFNNVKVWEL